MFMWIDGIISSSIFSLNVYFIFLSAFLDVARISIPQFRLFLQLGFGFIRL